MGVVLGESGKGGQDVVSVYLGRVNGECRAELREIYWVDGAAVYPAPSAAIVVPENTTTTAVLVVNERPPGVAGGAVLTVDGTSRSLALASTTRTGNFRADVGLGVFTVAGGDWDVSFDDVTIDYLR